MKYIRVVNRTVQLSVARGTKLGRQNISVRTDCNVDKVLVTVCSHNAHTTLPRRLSLFKRHAVSQIRVLAVCYKHLSC